MGIFVQKIDILENYLFTSDKSLFIYQSYRPNNSNNRADKFVGEILRISISDIVRCVLSWPYEEIQQYDIVQFSSFQDASVELIKSLKFSGNVGYNYVDIGKLLLGNNRSKVALQKYGENHSKMAEAIGLVNINNSKPRKIYLTNLGAAIAKVPVDCLMPVIARLIFRLRIIRYLFKRASVGSIRVKEEFNFLSEKTLQRRIPNLKKLIEVINENSEVDLSFFTESFDWKNNDVS